MGTLIVAVVVFLSFGMSLSYVVGYKEKVELATKLKQKTDEEKQIKSELKKIKTEAAETSSILKDTEEKLQTEREVRKKTEDNNLLIEKRLQDERKRIEEGANKEIEKLRSIVLSTKGRKIFDTEERFKTAVEARKKAEDKLLTAETAMSEIKKEAVQRMLSEEDQQKSEAEIIEEIELTSANANQQAAKEEIEKIKEEIIFLRKEEDKLAVELENTMKEVKKNNVVD